MPDDRFRRVTRFVRLARLGPLAACLCLPPLGCRPSASPSGPPGEPTPSRKGVVVSVSGPASDAGAAVLREGGNAVDAAVATAFSLPVTWPAAGNIGGGGYLLFHPSNGGEPVAIDFRETAPAAATRDMFVRPEDRTPHRRVGVPGTVAGLALAHTKHGKLPWKKLVEPATRLAGEGFELDAACARSLNDALRGTARPGEAEFRRVYGRPEGGEWRAGERLVQPELKTTLERIAEHGPEGFYAGPVADLLVAEMRRGGGIITKEDLAGYRALAKAPLRGTYRGYDIVCVPPSSSGGVALIEALNILEQFDLKASGRWDPRTSHLMVEAARRAFRDRACSLGDPAFANIPAFLTEKEYAKKLAAGIDLGRATPSKELAAEIKLAGDGDHTTHLSVVDGDGGAVSLTYTLESLYGGRVVVKGAGFLLNDEMNDFAWVPGVTDATGRIGTPPNQIAPGKRMLSSMCPTVVTKDAKPLLVTGSPGGRTIINTVFCVVVNVVDFGMSPREAVDAPRVHHQWLPDRLRVEPGFAGGNTDLVTGLKQLGHHLDPPAPQGDAHTIWINPGTGEIVGIEDRRISGKASPQ